MTIFDPSLERPKSRKNILLATARTNIESKNEHLHNIIQENTSVFFSKSGLMRIVD
jgi:hypothetical protein